jgi:hypothetical protein
VGAAFAVDGRGVRGMGAGISQPLAPSGHDDDLCVHSSPVEQEQAGLLHKQVIPAAYNNSCIRTFLVKIFRII